MTYCTLLLSFLSPYAVTKALATPFLNGPISNSYVSLVRLKNFSNVTVFLAGYTVSTSEETMTLQAQTNLTTRMITPTTIVEGLIKAVAPVLPLL